MAHDLVCWKCGASLAELSLPLRRLEECPKCRAELHVCRMCVDYDPRVAKACREPTAEEVNDKTRANFCDHFKPRPGAYPPPNIAEAERPRAAQPGGPPPPPARPPAGAATHARLSYFTVRARAVRSCPCPPVPCPWP